MTSFTYSNYRDLLVTCREAGYKFTSFSKVKFSKRKVRRKILLRHDIDLALERALRMAKIEAKMKVKATYFLFSKSPFYNLFSRDGEELTREIIKLGHYIGLHFDFAKYNGLKGEQVTRTIKREIVFIENFFDIKIDSVSFHRPKSLSFYQKLKLDSYPHAYEPIFTEEFTYLSDSRARWRYGYPLESEAFKKRENLHILVHPIWWNSRQLSGVKCIKRFKQEKMRQLEKYLSKELDAFWRDVRKK